MNIPLYSILAEAPKLADQVPLMKMAIGWTLIGFLLFTVIAVAISMIKPDIIPDPSLRKRLYWLLPIQVAATAIAVLGGLVEVSPEQVKQVITEGVAEKEKEVKDAKTEATDVKEAAAKVVETIKDPEKKAAATSAIEAAGVKRELAKAPAGGKTNIQLVLNNADTISTEKLRKGFTDAGYNVLPKEARAKTTFDETQVRYYSDEDKPKAEEVAAKLKAVLAPGKTARASRVDDPDQPKGFIQISVEKGAFK